MSNLDKDKQAKYVKKNLRTRTLPNGIHLVFNRLACEWEEVDEFGFSYKREPGMAQLSFDFNQNGA